MSRAARGLLWRSASRSCARVFTSAGVSAKPRAPKFGRRCLEILVGGVATCAAFVYTLDRCVVEASELKAHPPHLPWGFGGVISSLDHGAVRRGWEVYKIVCSSCHSLQYVSFKDLVDTCMTEKEAREIAAEAEVEDGPNELGEMFTRPGKLHDKIPSPFPNETAARAANNGAYPIDLSYAVSARHGGENYIFSLLTGYCDTPTGLQLSDSQQFNPYFEGGAIGMSEVLQDGMVDYDDGTPAYKSQMAKDVTEFLVWTANHDWDTRKVVLLKGAGICVILFASLIGVFRQKKAYVKNTQLYFVPKTKSSENC